MARLSRVAKSRASGVVAEYYEKLFGDRDPVESPGTDTGSRGDWWTTYALVPPVFEHAVAHFKIFGMFSDQSKSILEPAIRELGILRAAYVAQSAFVFSQHSKVARSVGVSQQKIDLIGCWQCSDAFSKREKVVLAYADCLLHHHGRVADELFRGLKKQLSDEEILEFTYHTLLYFGYAISSRAFRLEYDDVDSAMVEHDPRGVA